MTAAARTHDRRDACPGLSTPMPTGDGLLARLMPAGTIGLEQMAGLAAAAERHGNGVIEITSRGSIQVRGLRPDSAPAFADAVAELGIAAHDGVPIICDPLAGLDPRELIDAGRLASELRAALDSCGITLSPKVSIAIDGGGPLHLDALPADIRLRAMPPRDRSRLRVAVGGDAASAISTGTIARADAIDTVLWLLRSIAARGPQARGRDLLGRQQEEAPAARPGAQPVGVHELRDGTMALGIGFAFGHADAATLTRLAHAATQASAAGLRTAPGRTLLAIGIAAERVPAFADAAKDLGFIVAPDDPRRLVVACAGAPICASGEIATRTLAPAIAASAAPHLGVDDVIHVSGCAKGCAHHGAAALTAIGRAGGCDLFVDGVPAGSAAAAELPRHLAALAAMRSSRRG